MKSIKIDLYSLVVMLMAALLPFSYFDPFGIRVIAISFFLFLFMVFYSLKSSLIVDKNLLFFLIPFFMVAFFSIVSESKNIFSLAIFISYLFAFNFINELKLKGVVNEVGVLYLYGAVLMALGVIVQRLAFEIFGYEFGKIDFYGGGRVGFGFLWLDYSFLSLYLVSAVPLVFYYLKSYGAKSIVLLILLAGSAVTTARTGLVALFITAFCVGMLEFVRILLIGRISRRVVLLTVFVVVVSGFLFYYYYSFSSRSMSFSDSGRFEGFFTAFQSFLDRPFVGVMFDSEYYKRAYGVVPHNLFFYILSHGGILFFVSFFFWFSYVLYVAVFRVEVFKYPVVIAALGFMFIPSFFSAYFFALLIALAMAEKRIFRMGIVENEKSLSI